MKRVKEIRERYEREKRELLASGIPDLYARDEKMLAMTIQAANAAFAKDGITNGTLVEVRNGNCTTKGYYRGFTYAHGALFPIIKRALRNGKASNVDLCVIRETEITKLL